jgi:putative ABC transport system permease protein
VFLNPAAMAALVPGGLAGASGPSLQLQSALALRAVIVAGTVNAPGAPLAVMDIGAAQDLFGAAGRLSRIDLRLQPGTDRAAFIAALQLPAGVTAGEPGDAAERVSNLSRAYRVNLTVLALVALFTGAFLVFSVLSLSVARRAQQFALLGVLGLTPLQRLRLVLVESLLLGAAGSTAGIALGTALAALALRLLGGDLGGGFFAGVAPPLQWEGAAALLYGLLGVAAAGVGGWWPARAAQHLPPAQTLKGLGAALQSGQHRAVPLLLIAAGVLLAQTPPVAGIPLAAYVSVGLLLVGGITALPWLIGLTYDRLAPWVSRRLLPLLAVERARRVRESAAVAVSGVVASLSLAVALTVMVASFRDSVTHWLDVVLPADLYVRAAMGTGAADTVYFPPELVGQIAQLPGVKRLATQRFVPLQLDPARPAVALISRDGDGMGRGTALVGEALPVPVGQIGIWVSEAMVDLYGARPGQVFAPLSAFFRPVPSAERSSSATFFVAGVWRDYARQSGAIVIDRHDYERLTGDRRVNDLALWLADGADAAQVQADVRRAARWAPACGGRRARHRAGVRLGRADPRHLAAHLRPQLCRHLLAAGRGHCHRPVRRGGELQRAGAGPAQGVRPAGAPGSDTAPDPGGGGRRRRGMDGHRRAGRAAAGAGGLGRAGESGEPAELSLDHGPGRTLGAPAGSVRGGGGRGHGDGLAVRAGRGRARCGAGGEGGLVMRRRSLLLAGVLGGPLARPGLAATPVASALPRRALVFPRDHGAHPELRTEWWYVTGQARDPGPGDANSASR